MASRNIFFDLIPSKVDLSSFILEIKSAVCDAVTEMLFIDYGCLKPQFVEVYFFVVAL